MTLLMMWFACGGLDEADIRTLVVANTTVLAEVEARLEEVESKVDDAKHGEGDGDYAFSGTLDAGGAWDGGTIAVDGTGTSADEGSITYSDVDLVYQDVAIDGLILDGPVSATFSVTIVDGDVDVLYDVMGDLTVRGAASGSADMDWRMQALSSAGGTPTYTGTVNSTALESVF